MGNDEAATPSKPEKPSSPVKDQPVIYPYPDWTAMQAYYGPGVMPPPYFTTTVPPGHAPHPYIWGPQPLLPPFGTPYAAMYTHPGGYSRPAVPMGPHIHSGGLQSSESQTVVMANPLSVELPAMTAGNKDRSPTKKLKEPDGVAENTSGHDTADGSNDGNGAAAGSKKHRKRSSEDRLGSDDSKVDKQVNTSQGSEASGSSKLTLAATLAPAESAGKPVGQASSSLVPMTNSSFGGIGNVKAIGTPMPPSTAGMVPARNGTPSEFWVKDERELKREKRKQSNRESARRSRLRKQAETEELATKVDALTAENSTLRSEIIRLSESSEKLRLENSTLMEKLAYAQPAGQIVHKPPDDINGTQSMVVENFLSMIDKPKRTSGQLLGNQEQNNSGKLRQKMDSGPRTDAVAAS